MNETTITIAAPISGVHRRHEVDANIEPWFGMSFMVDVHWQIDASDDPEVVITEVHLWHIALHASGNLASHFPTWFVKP